MAGAETAQFAGGYGLAPFTDYGSNMLQYGGNRGLRNQINLGTANMQGFIGRGGGGMQGNFQTSPFLNQGSLAHLSPSFVEYMAHIYKFSLIYNKYMIETLFLNILIYVD